MEQANRGEAKRQEIVGWAFDHFYDGGFHATGVDKILAETGISKRTLYKYFASKEELIEAVLAHYAVWMSERLFDRVAASGRDPREQIIGLFDARKEMLEEYPARGCLGLKAAQEYIGKHAGIAAKGKAAANYVEQAFISLCVKSGFARAEALGRQINIIFQGAVLLSQIRGDTKAFAAAKSAVRTLFASADAP
ncbi:TetR/AcrR family transcriptional regulator [Pseudolabrys taiwanensis]|uniref:TetR/AcrR family transcriptional regulator n=2 Tax=Pseudolabrys taiwanensis TaxID=331696 RepID=A0A346A4A8_9HYPH|nr:TetR/AcrR family transcriptional regulator [Pseudolabrys taiwanensis]